jgi:hypothetical protein
MPQLFHSVNPVRNSSGALNPARISNGVNPLLQTEKDYIDYETITQIRNI